MNDDEEEDDDGTEQGETTVYFDAEEGTFVDEDGEEVRVDVEGEEEEEELEDEEEEEQTEAIPVGTHTITSRFGHTMLVGLGLG